jgi:AhpD family alkylhydroperoxidase
MKRINLYQVDPQTLEKMMGFEKYLEQATIPKTLIELIKLRVSQLNGCGYCIDMHTKLGRQYGESEQRMHVLNAWKHSTMFTEREKAAFRLAEAVTLLPEQEVADDVYQAAAEQFSEKELAEIIMTIITINSWNRLAIVQELKAPYTV